MPEPETDAAGKRDYSQEQRIEAVGLAMSVGVKRAALQLGIPHRTISEWKVRPDMQSIVAASRDELRERLWEAIQVGVEQVLSGLQDPSARLSDKARALEVLSQQHALLSGEATSRVETASVNFNASWQPPAGAEPILTGAELKLLEKYLIAVDQGRAPVIDVEPRLLDSEAATAPEMASDTAPALIESPRAVLGGPAGFWEDDA